MESRVNLEQTKSEAWKALYHLSTVFAKSSALTPIQRHLISLRTSQINSCAFCINMHTKEALQSGETQQRIFLLSAWKETQLFSQAEEAILLMTEEITLISQQGLSDGTYQKATKFFSPAEIGDIILAIVLMNTWNRIAVSTNLPLN